MLKALANPVRLCIVKCLLDEVDCSVSDLMTKADRPQPTISQHLNILKAYGIVEGNRNGTTINYTIANKTVKKIVELLFEDVNINLSKEERE